jgi:hypothetical protein
VNAFNLPSRDIKTGGKHKNNNISFNKAAKHKSSRPGTNKNVKSRHKNMSSQFSTADPNPIYFWKANGEYGFLSQFFKDGFHGQGDAIVYNSAEQ